MNLTRTMLILMLAGGALMAGGLAQPEKATEKSPEKSTEKGEFTQKPAVTPAAEAFSKLKAIAGSWDMADEEGKNHHALESKVSSAGSILREVMFPGADHEMTNMYHLDGDAIIATHYCAIGNQPRMACTDFSKPGVYHFTFKDVTNRATPDDAYMGELTLTIVDADTLTQHWVHFVKGERGGEVTFTMKRRGDVKSTPEPKPEAKPSPKAPAGS